MKLAGINIIYLKYWFQTSDIPVCLAMPSIRPSEAIKLLRRVDLKQTDRADQAGDKSLSRRCLSRRRDVCSTKWWCRMSEVRAIAETQRYFIVVLHNIFILQNTGLSLSVYDLVKFSDHNSRTLNEIKIIKVQFVEGSAS